MTNLTALESRQRILTDQIAISLTGINDIKDQLDRAKTRRITTGEFTDPDWFQRANSALRGKGRILQDIQRELGEVNRALRRARGEQSDAALVVCLTEAATRLIGREKWNEIFDAAIAIRRSRPQGELCE